MDGLEQIKKERDELREENRRLKEELAKAKEDYAHKDRVIAMATSLRYHMMPSVYPAFPDCPGLDIYTDQIGLADVGGDFCDYFRIDADHIGIVVADIFDGGNAAALYMVAFKLFLAAEAAMGFSVDHVMEVVNNRLVKCNEDNLCLSAWFGIYEESTGVIRAVNAGHEPSILCTADGIDYIKREKINYLLAVTEDMAYGSYEIHLNPGDILLLYTDGVLKAANSDGDEFDGNKIMESLLHIKDRPADEIVGELQGELLSFIGDENLTDDASFLCVIRKETRK